MNITAHFDLDKVEYSQQGIGDMNEKESFSVILYYMLQSLIRVM